MNIVRPAAFLAAAVLSAACFASPAGAQEDSAGIDDAQLEQLIRSIGLKPTRTESRFDFEFKATMGSDQWQLSMSSVLSQDGRSVWLMAWLDELPKSAAKVPRTALLRLLAENDKMGNGKFFAYIAGNRRFVLQRIIPTAGLTSDAYKIALQDLGSTVVQTFPQWSVAGWVPTEPAQVQTAARPERTEEAPQVSTTNESKFELPVRR